MRPLVPAPSHPLEVEPARSRAAPPGPPVAPIVLLLVVAVGGYWLWQERETPTPPPREPMVTLPSRTIRDIVAQLENAQRLNNDASADMGANLVLVRQVAPFFRNNGLSANYRRTVAAENKLLSAQRLTTEANDEISLALERLKEDTQ